MKIGDNLLCEALTHFSVHILWKRWNYYYNKDLEDFVCKIKKGITMDAVICYHFKHCWVVKGQMLIEYMKVAYHIKKLMIHNVTGISN